MPHLIVLHFVIESAYKKAGCSLLFYAQGALMLVILV